jgi:hypothetical protein
MRTVVVGFALIMLAGVADAQPREPYSSAEGKYRIKFPGTPKVTDKTTNSAAGELTVNIATYATSDGNTYVVSYLDYPNAVDPKNQAKFFDALRDEVKGTDGKLIGSEKDRTIGEEKRPAREFTVEKNRQRIRLRVVLRQNRLYQVGVIGTADFVTGKDANAFMDSLELTK